MKKLLNIFMNTISAVLILMGIAAILLFAIPTVAGYKPFVVLSGSMEPEIQTGAIAYNNTHAKVEDVKVGDVIVFKLDKSYVTHRVISINDDNTFTTKGDANQTEDLAPVKFENFKEKTVFTIPYLGKALKLIQTRNAVFILVVAVGLTIVYAIFSEDDEKKKKSKEDKKIKERNTTEETKN